MLSVPRPERRSPSLQEVDLIPVLLFMATAAVAQDPVEVEPLDLSAVNADSLAVLAGPQVEPEVLEAIQARLGAVFSEPERLGKVPAREEVARYWQAHGLVALHRGADPEGALRLACLLDPAPVAEVKTEGFYEAFAEACALPPPALVPMDLGELSGTWAVWIDGAPHGVGQYVRSGQHLVQITEDTAVVSSRWVKASASPPPSPPVDPPDGCAARCRSVRIGAVSALVLAGGLATVAIHEAAVEEKLDGEAATWGISTADTVRRVKAVSRRNAAGAGAGVALGVGLTGLVVASRF